MGRGALLDPDTLVEKFADWARERGQERFWGIVKTRDGRVCLLLNDNKRTGYRVLLITDLVSEDIHLVTGYPEDEWESDETTIGTVNDEPGALFEATIEWLLALVREYLALAQSDPAMSRVCRDLAKATESIALGSGDVMGAAEAVVAASTAPNLD